MLTGDPEAQGRGTPSDEVRDATGRVPNLWFGDVDPAAGYGTDSSGADSVADSGSAADSDSDSTADSADHARPAAPVQRFHVEVYVAPEVAQQRIAAAVAAGGTVVDDSESPSLTVIADPEGNRGVLCVAQA